MIVDQRQSNASWMDVASACGIGLSLIPSLLSAPLHHHHHRRNTSITALALPTQVDVFAGDRHTSLLSHLQARFAKRTSNPYEHSHGPRLGD